MAWFEPNPPLADLDFWQGAPAPVKHKVSKWPHPNTPRINCRYRFKDTRPELIPLAHRYGFFATEAFQQYDPDVPEFNFFGSFDLAVRGDNHIGVTTPENAEGYTLDINVKHRELLDFTEFPGIEYSVKFEHVSIPEATFIVEYSTRPVAHYWNYDNNTLRRDEFIHTRWEIPGQTPAQLLSGRLFAVSDCYLFPLLPPGWAAFNGTDAYIKLTSLMSFSNNPFRLSCELRLNQTANHWPILGRDGTGGFFGMRDDDIIFGNLTLPTTWTPITDVWFTWVYEFEPETQLQHKLTIAGTVVKDTTTNRQHTPFDTIGVYRHGVANTLWADMDMRDLKIETGTPGDYTTLLDMPLRENALDLGPLANHGTTFNMPLPSV